MIYIPFVSPIPNPQNLKSSSALLAVVIPDALLEQVLRRLDAPLGPVDGDDPLVASGQGLVNGYGSLGVGADLPDPGAAGPDDGPGHVLGDGDLGGLLLAAVIFIASEHSGAAAATAEAAEVTAAATSAETSAAAAKTAAALAETAAATSAVAKASAASSHSTPAPSATTTATASHGPLVATGSATSVSHDVHLGAVAAVLVGVEPVEVVGVVGLLVALDLGGLHHLQDQLHGLDYLVSLTDDGDAPVGGLGGAGLVDLDVGARVLPDLLDLEPGPADDPSDDGLVDEKADLLVVASASSALVVAYGVVHEGQGLLHAGDDLGGTVGQDGHDPLGSWAVWDPDVGVVVGAELLDVGASLADDGAGDLGGDHQPALELVTPGPLVLATPLAASPTVAHVSTALHLVL